MDITLWSVVGRRVILFLSVILLAVPGRSMHKSNLDSLVMLPKGLPLRNIHGIVNLLYHKDTYFRRKRDTQNSQKPLESVTSSNQVHTQSDDVTNSTKDGTTIDHLVCNSDVPQYTCKCYQNPQLASTSNVPCCSERVPAAGLNHAVTVLLKNKVLADYDFVFEGHLKDVISSAVANFCTNHPSSCGVSAQPCSLHNQTNVIILNVVQVANQSGSQNVIQFLQISLHVHIIDCGITEQKKTHVLTSDFLTYILTNQSQTIISDIHGYVTVSPSNQTVIQASCMVLPVVPTRRRFTLREILSMTFGALLGVLTLPLCILSVIKAVW